MPERSQPENSIPHFAVHRLRRRAAAGRGELNSEQAEIDRLFVTQPEGGRPDPKVIDAADVARGFGLPDDQVSRVAKVVHETRANFSTKGAQQHIVAARGKLVEIIRAMRPHMPSDVRQEVLRRAISYWKAQSPIDLGRTPQLRYGIAKGKKTAAVIPLKKAMNAEWGTGPTGSGGPGSRTDSLPDFSIYEAPEYQGRRPREIEAAQNRLADMREKHRGFWGPAPTRDPELRYEASGVEARYVEKDDPKLGISRPTHKSPKGQIDRLKAPQKTYEKIDEEDTEEDEDDARSRKKRRSRKLVVRRN